MIGLYSEQYYSSGHGIFAGLDDSPPTPSDEAKTGTGGIDAAGEARRRNLIKPTGFTERTRHKERANAAIEQDTAVEIAERIAIDFADENAALEAAALARAAILQASLTEAEITAEIAALLHSKLRTEEDEIVLLIMMAVAVSQ